MRWTAKWRLMKMSGALRNHNILVRDKMPPKFAKSSEKERGRLLDVEEGRGSDDSEEESERVIFAGSRPKQSSHRGHSSDASNTQSASHGGPAIAKVQGQVNDVMDVMRGNIDKMMQRGERLDNLEEKSDHLTAGASQFRRSTTGLRRQLWWQNFRMKMILVAVILVILAVIVVTIVIKTTSKDGK